jgi:hypothetical protein
MDLTDMGLGGKHTLDSYGSEKGQETDCCDNDNQPLGSAKLGEFLD